MSTEHEEQLQSCCCCRKTGEHEPPDEEERCLDERAQLQPFWAVFHAKLEETSFVNTSSLTAICLTLKRRSSITICSTRAIKSSDRLVRGRGSFWLFSQDVRPSLNCRTHERKFFTSITPSLHVSLNY